MDELIQVYRDDLIKIKEVIDRILDTGIVATGYKEGMGSKPVKVKISIDDATPQEWNDASKKSRVKNLSQKAFLFETSQLFARYIEASIDFKHTDKSEPLLKPKQFIYNHCDITSKTELDTNEEAANKFIELQESVKVWDKYKGIC